ncbi:MAG: 3-dehydroquinate synthase [Phycisphaerae bacterium]|nr:3-dehydroquinate synthase [Phycisphaerae bacterium]
MKVFNYTFDRRPCRVTIGDGVLRMAGSTISRCRRGGKVLVVSDSNVAPLYADPVCRSLREAGLECRLAVVPAGEDSKSSERLAELYDELADMRLGRDGFLVAVGGGVVGDLTGFAAATWLRGVDFVICPTSVMAVVDASIGGKTGINHHTGKNLIGAFHQPVEVLIDPTCLRTLERRDLQAGLAESIKHALIEDEGFVSWHEAQREPILGCHPQTMGELIARNVAIKAKIVTQDAREQSGIRARLNFGHTIGHAIEASCGYRLRHGECVAFGMVAASRISQVLGLLSEEQHERVEALIRSFGLAVPVGEMTSYETLSSYIAGDKKVAASRVRWVLLSGIGRSVIRDDVDEAVVRDAIALTHAPRSPWTC